MTSALDFAASLLRCPVCGAALHRTDRTLRDDAGHAFDVAKQGYVTLLAGGRPHHGDTAPMVAARERFLTSGHYATIARAVAHAADTAPAGPLLDLAAGTGWYAVPVLDRAPDRIGVAVDVSVPALRRAARAHPRLAAVGADAWGHLPVADGAVAVVLSVFGPRSPAELARVLVPGGVVVAVTPTPAHLGEIVGPLGMLEVGSDKGTRLRDAFAAFNVVAAERVEYPLRLDHVGVADLAGMGPTGHHVDADALGARVTALPDPVTVTVSVDVTTFVSR